MEPAPSVRELPSTALKQCCAASYESEAARLLLGDSLHPGGAKLTEHLGRILNITPRTRVLDVAAGKGMSAITLAETFGCPVVGVDYGQKNVDDANQHARDRGLEKGVSFRLGDAERLPFPDESFDVVICECAFCLFPNKQAAALEVKRVLGAGGLVGMSDLVRSGTLAPELEGLLPWIACIADAQPLASYVALLSAAQLEVRATEAHDEALVEFVNQIRTRLLMAEVMVGLNKAVIPGFDFETAKNLAKHVLEAIKQGRLGYAIVTASKPI